MKPFLVLFILFVFSVIFALLLIAGIEAQDKNDLTNTSSTQIIGADEKQLIEKQQKPFILIVSYIPYIALLMMLCGGLYIFTHLITGRGKHRI